MLYWKNALLVPAWARPPQDRARLSWQEASILSCLPLQRCVILEHFLDERIPRCINNLIYAYLSPGPCPSAVTPNGVILTMYPCCG